MKNNRNAIALQYSLILSTTLIILGLIIYYAGLLGAKWTSYVGFVFYLGILYVAQKQLATTNGNDGLTYGQAVGLAAIIGLITALILIFYNYLFYTLIAPDAIQQIKDIAEQQMMDKGMADDKIEMALKMQSKFMTPLIMSAFGFIGQFIGIVVAGLLTAIVTKKEPIIEE